MNIFHILARILLWGAPAIGVLFIAKQLMQFAQLASYQAGGLVRAFIRLPMKAVWPGTVLSAVCILFLFIGSLILRLPGPLAFLLSVVLFALITAIAYMIGFFAYQEKRVKVRLVYTTRVKRLYAALFLVAALLTYLMYRAGWAFGTNALVPLLTPLLLLMALIIIWPLEKAVQLLFRADAKQILEAYKKTGLRVIGITGSYGKTTVKNILYAMLSQTWPTLATPASFNTPMGLSRCIREDLGQQHLFFIAEMGARHPQDIRVLCRMVKPEAGILTSIGPQHLQTMGSIKQVAATKYDLIRALPKDGFAVFYDDGKLAREGYDKTGKPKAIVGTEGSDAWAEDVTLLEDGSRFTLCFADEVRLPVSTHLAGEHNINNILLAAVMARHYGVTPQKIALALEQVAPIPSRLQINMHHRGYKVINNGFNSNPDSSRKALEVLASQQGRLIVVTPGFIELGRQEHRSNRRLGNDIAAVADMAILIGEKHTRPIKTGLLESGMEEDNIKVFPTLSQANLYIEELFGPGDVLLYENDLPDHYA
ncbi:MAG: UDP-N-acetylmuramoyl-tripeptide--D-alanyl-D-alanine ligase [Clostridiales bacterium]|nr:UDP-N-acetylmuramoyl-tripeptide--D-alanyl-D-alanine ligase [Clostridiales bacterium]